MRHPRVSHSPEVPDRSEYETSAGRSRNMSAIRRRDTKPEIALRSQLHRRGLRFRKDHAIRVDGRLIRPDIAFTKRRVAIFIDGCFWHSCPQHGRKPSVNQNYWSPKLERNSKRDAEQTEALQSAGWVVLRYWEHEDLAAVVDSIAAAIEPST
ncbi:very short patch repair endonuclease [Mycolicibacterium goodii]|uniref:very short patch repair endonuclease n=1 Tax=Mycolicibacterium goodii TaxID=134601 RepID=UPI003D9C9CD9